jgi:hypothetical protein
VETLLAFCIKRTGERMKNIIYLKVEFDNLDDIGEPEILECLLNVLDERCAEHVGVRNGPQFHRLDKSELPIGMEKVE